MAAEAEKIEELTVPDGGIGNFVMDDDELEAAYGDDDDGVEEYGDEGIAQFPALTKKMAAMGREGDDTIAHVQTGELIIPADFFKDDPEFKEAIFQKLREAGVEDPERYVVGSDANSIHPETGAPEFFKFIKKIFKKVGNAVKKIVKSVVKVVKKVAPVILPIALSFTPLGAVYGAALGSGIGTLIQGGSIKDALKSALVAGATGAVFKGFTGPDTFMNNVKDAVAQPFARFGQTVSGAQTSLQNIFGGEAARAANVGKQTFFSEFVPQAASGVAGGAENVRVSTRDVPSDVIDDAVTSQTPAQTSATEALRNADTAVARLNNTGSPVDVTLTTGQTATIPSGGQIPAGATVNPTTAPTVPTYEPPSFTESIRGALTPGDDISFTQGMKDAFFPAGPTADQVAAAQANTARTTFGQQISQGIDPSLATQVAAKAAEGVTASSLGPGFLRTYAPLATAGLTAATAAGAFEPIPAEELGIAERDADGNVITGEDLVAADPSKYLVGDLGSVVLDPNTGEYVPRDSYSVGPLNDLTIQAPNYDTYNVPTQFTYNPNQYFLQGSTPGGPFARPVQYAAEGGEIFPRRNGGIMPNEGIPGQDSVRAMLMPGEFVMTTDAVRGLGNGNLNNGIQNMYSVMRNLESRGRAMA